MKYRNFNGEAITSLHYRINLKVEEYLGELLKKFLYLKGVGYDYSRIKELFSSREKMASSKKNYLDNFLKPDTNSGFFMCLSDSKYAKDRLDVIKKDRLNELSNLLTEVTRRVKEKPGFDLNTKRSSGEEILYRDILVTLLNLGVQIPEEDKKWLYDLRWIGDPKEHLKKAGWLDGLE